MSVESHEGHDLTEKIAIGTGRPGLRLAYPHSNVLRTDMRVAASNKLNAKYSHCASLPYPFQTNSQCSKEAFLDLQTIVAELKRERDRLSKAIAALEGTDMRRTSLRSAAVVSSRAPRKRKRRLTPEGRKRLSEMMKKRWAERRKQASQGRK